MVRCKVLLVKSGSGGATTTFIEVTGAYNPAIPYSGVTFPAGAEAGDNAVIIFDDAQLYSVYNGATWVVGPLVLNGVDFTTVAAYSEESVARLALPSGTLFRWSENNLDGVSSPNNTTIGLII